MDLNFAFDHLHIADATAVFRLPWISPEAHLIVRPAIEANQPYFDALMRLNSGRPRQAARKVRDQWHDGEVGEVERKEREESRNEDVKLLPGLVVVGWGGIPNRRGEMVPFSVDACASFLRALPDWIIDRLRSFVMSPNSFVREAPPLPKAEDIVGNSTSA